MRIFNRKYIDCEKYGLIYSFCFVRFIIEFDNYCKYNKFGLNKYIII